MNIMKTLEKYLNELQRDKVQIIAEQVQLFEHKIYKLIPGTTNSYRPDSGNTNTMVLNHSHVYAKPKGKGGQLYALNIDGSGHDCSTNIKIPASHANHFRDHGYNIKNNNILEGIDLEDISLNEYSLIIIEIA